MKKPQKVRRGLREDDDERRVPKRQRRQGDGEDELDDFVPPEISKRILEQARLQQEELRKEASGDQAASKVQGGFDEHVVVENLFDDDSLADGDEDRYVEIEDQDQFTAEDEKAMAAFMAANQTQQRRTIADIIMEKLNAHDRGFATSEHSGKVRMDPKVVQCFKNVGRMLKVYRSGKLPKAFKIVPSLSNWEEVVYHTDPDEWSPNALRHATRLFASNLNPQMAQRFYNLILLPRIRVEIAEKKKLHWSIYQALRKACYKPAAFYKGIILPLCEAGDCTLREATIIGSVIRHVSLPVLHSSVALLKIAEMPYTGANSIFMRFIIEKKYALPYRVLDGIVRHFSSFATDTRKLPVLWHRCLLSFAQRYKTDLNAEQLDLLKHLLRAQNHELITPEIRNQLFMTRPAGPAVTQSTPTMALAPPTQEDIVME